MLRAVNASASLRGYACRWGRGDVAAAWSQRVAQGITSASTSNSISSSSSSSNITSSSNEPRMTAAAAIHEGAFSGTLPVARSARRPALRDALPRGSRNLRAISTAAAASAAASGPAGTSPSAFSGVSSDEPADVTSDGKIRLATFQAGGQAGPASVGLVRRGKVWKLADLLEGSAVPGLDPNDMVSVIKAWHAIYPRLADEPAGPGIDLADVRLLAPIPSPSGAIMCIGKNYAEHVKEVDTWKTAPDITAPSIPQHPIVFTKAPQAVIGPGAAIRLPAPDVSASVDYEAEVALIIGKEGARIPQESAMDHVFGFTILNDVTARDVQKKHQQWFLGKSCDTFCPMGPWIVPASEIDGQDIGIKCWINDELRQDSRTSQLIFSIPVLIETISKTMTLRPGDIIATGTPSGVGSGFNPPKHLKAGDVVRIKVEGIGELANSVA